MAIAIVITTSAVFAGSGGTTSSINTTGANLLVAALSYQQSSTGNISDSKGNTWIPLTEYAAGTAAAVRIYYCSNPTVGSGHTFTTTSHFVGVNIMAFSGVRTATSPLDQQNGTVYNPSVTPETSGSITPSVTGTVVITVTCIFNPGSTPTIPSGYTSVGTYPTATAEAGGCAYKILSGTGAENPSWTAITTGTNSAVAVVNFMPPGVAVTTTGFMAFF